MRKLTILIGVIILMWGCATVRSPRLRPPLAIEYFSRPPNYEVLFKRHETMLLIFDDDTCVSFSSYERGRVTVSKPFIETTLEYLGKEWGDIEIIIHNHFHKIVFSPGDAWFLHCIKLRGFKGKFQLYFVPDNMVIQETR